MAQTVLSKMNLLALSVVLMVLPVTSFASLAGPTQAHAPRVDSHPNRGMITLMRVRQAAIPVCIHAHFRRATDELGFRQ